MCSIKKILVLEDESGIRSFVVINLRRNGYEPIEAATGGEALDAIAAALILADKTDVRRSRVRNKDMSTFDIHDRVNYSVERSEVLLDLPGRTVTLSLSINTEVCAVMDYFEIFLQRMLLSRKAAETLDLKFRLEINGQILL